MEALVSTEWLAAQLPSSDLIVFDASWYMPAEGRDPAAEYRQGHIPGALRFDIDAIADTESALPHMVPTAARFEHMIGALGVAAASRVVNSSCTRSCEASTGRAELAAASCAIRVPCGGLA